MAPFIYDDDFRSESAGGVPARSSEADMTVPIAIIGMSCRFPGEATDVERLWKMCAESRDAWSAIPEDRFNLQGYYHPDSSRPGTTYVRGGHFLSEDLSHFDAPFFNITREEAASMDPQQRLVLECSYEALENAGTTMKELIGSDTSVYMGSFCRDWTDILNRDIETLPFYQATGTGQALLANRLSYFYDLKGPSISLDTACSSSLVAVHLACQSLRSGESKQAIVGGSNIILSHETMISMSRMRFLSPDGRCYTYDHRANGYSRGEGAACIILKPLAEALRNGDTIRGIIRNTGTNQDGKTHGITLPSSEAQESLVRRVYKEAGLDPARTGYVEAHGTGTPAGDPLEAAALSKVFGPGRPASQPLVVGSIKTNIGHLEGASGLAGLIKTVLMLENNLILPNVNFEKANPSIPLHEWKLKVPATVQSWPTTGVRRASVCNYGYGGSNSHVVIDDADGYLAFRGLKGSYRTTLSIPASVSLTNEPPASFTEDKRARVFVLSAFDDASGKVQAKRLASYLSERKSLNNKNLLNDLAFTLAQRRSILPYKAAVLASSASQLIDVVAGEDIKYSKSTKTPSLGFVFTGQGAQWHAMGRELVSEYPVFRSSLVTASKYLKMFGASWSLLDELSKTAEESQIGLSYLSQPLCTAIQIALVDLLASWGVTPTSVTGHSSGEIAAAYAAGALSQESALAIAYYRGLAAPAIKEKYPQRKGSMLAVGLSKEETQGLISNLTSGKVVVACINSPSSVTVSGDDSAVNELLEILQIQKIFARKLSVEVAYHSHHMDCVGDDYLDALQRIRIQGPKKAEFYSSVTGERMDFCELGPSYWVTNMLCPVEFSDSLRNLCLDLSDERRERGLKSAVDILIELGPHSALAGPIKQILQADPTLRTSSVRYFSALTRNKNAVETSLQLVAQLFKSGYPIEFNSINNASGELGHSALVDLPPYAWNHSQSYEIESRESRNYRSRSSPRSDILGAHVRNALPLEPRWRNYVRPAEIPWVRDHRIQSDMVYPAGGFIAMAVEAACQHTSLEQSEISGYNLREITIGHALVVPEGEVETMFCLRPYSEGSRATSETWFQFCIFSVAGAENWTEHCRGLISVQKKVVANEVDGQRLVDEEKAFHANMIAEAEATCSKEVDIKKIYNDLKAAGLHYGPTFAIMARARAAPYQSVGRIHVHDTAAVMPSQFEYPFVVHPSTLDGCIQVLFPGIAEAEGPIQEAAMPTYVEEMFVSSRISREPDHEFRVYAKSEKTSVRQSASSIAVFNKDEADLDPMITFTGLTCSSLPKAHTNDVREPRKLCFKTRWAASPDFLSSQQANDIWQAGNSSDKYSNAASYIDCLAHKNPHLKCLEIGAGTGNVTCAILEALGSSDSSVPRFTSYEITDTTNETFEEVKIKTMAWDKLVSFKKLDIESDPLNQGFESESYDLVIAASGTERMSKTMSSMRKLLKPEGRFILLESTPESNLPTTTQNERDYILSQARSSDLEVCITSTPAETADEVAMMVFKPIATSACSLPEVMIIADEGNSYGSAEHLKALLSGFDKSAEITTLSDAKPRGKVCIVLSEIAQSILSGPSNTQFESIQRVLSESSGTLWVTRGATIESGSPDSNLISGLARTVNLESSSKVVTLDLETKMPINAEALAQTVAKVFWRSFNSRHSDGVLDVEYSERGGVIMIPRVVEDRELNTFVSSTTEDPIPEIQLFSQTGRLLAIEVGNPGQLDSLRFVDDVRMERGLPDDHVQIEVKASSLNSHDVAVVTGRAKVGPIGCECSGVISAVGKDVLTLKLGDRVVCHAQGTLCNVIQQKASTVQILPEDISFELGAALPIVYTTAYYSLFRMANLEADDTVLIHAAAGSQGQAHVKLCQVIGSEIFTTVANLEEKDFVMSELHIPESHIFSIQGGSFARGIMRMTGNKGVDVIVNSVSGEAFRQSWDCIAPFGRFIELATENLTTNARLEMGKFAKNVTLAAVDLEEMLSQRPEQTMKIFAKVMSLIRDGTVSPALSVTTFGMAEVQTALRTLQAERHRGKVVVMPQPHEMVKVIPRDTRNSLFRADSSYLLVGGLGGLGRAIASWMVRCGAKNLIFASRSGLAKQSARSLVEDIESKGTRVAVFNCDISKVEELENLLAQSAKSMPPTRGVIQAAMVIKNSFFQNMTLSDYTASIQPKVRGTWNLHDCLPKDTLDFFILLSSAVGIIGNASQAAYAAASTFQDAFASYRTNLGLPAISLDLGMIDDVGYVAENQSVQKSLEKLGFEGVKEAELMAMLHSAIKEPLRTTKPAYTISGLGTYKESELRPALANPRFSHFRRMGEYLARNSSDGPPTGGSGSAIDAFHAVLRQTASVDEAAEKISEALMEKMATLLMVPREEISPSKPMAEYGMDSLVAVQMRAWVAVAMEAQVSILELLVNVEVRVLALVVAGRSKLVKGGEK
ncbi:hypothetical protein MMC30_001238 [Trapelia coarctata]|nr:hypothetical protein [Trapelia coarctata]